MGRNILFVSKYPEIVQEFLDAMRDKDAVVDTASNGKEATEMLQNKEYQIVVTGLVLDFFNGEKLVTYVNKAFPNTICIIYTTTISAPQLHFFMNKRDVFRVFLRPVDFRKEFYQAIEDAFLYYEVRVKNEKEAEEYREASARYQRGIETLKRKLQLQKVARERILTYMERLMEISLDEYASRLSAEGKRQLKGLERDVAGLCLKESRNPAENLARAQKAVEQIQKIGGR